MASYSELRNLANSDALRNKAEVAVIVAANTVLRANPARPAAEIAWAQAALQSPTVWAQRALWVALAQNRALNVTQINNASDSDFQASIDAVVGVLSTGMVPGA